MSWGEEQVTGVRRTHQCLHHFVAHAPWGDEALLAQVCSYALPAMTKHGPVVAWIVDDTGFVKKGTHSVGVARQYCGQVGKQENCRVAVSLSVATATRGAASTGFGQKVGHGVTLRSRWHSSGWANGVPAQRVNPVNSNAR